MSLLQPLCDNLDLSLNELFSGEHISAEEYKEKAEENIGGYADKRFRVVYSVLGSLWEADI